MRKTLLLLAIVAALAAPTSVGVALADPDFGPGNSSKGPHDPGAKCHPPGQTVDEPACKDAQAGMSDGGAREAGWSWNDD